MKKQTLLLTMTIVYCVGTGIVYSQGTCWVKKKDMSVVRGVMPAVVLNDTIYATGGTLDAYTSTSVVEAYDATTDTWTPKASLPQKLCGTTAGTVNGKIYVIGGSTSILGTGYVVASVYEYNPGSNSWTTRSNIPTPIAYAAADVVDGKIYVIGGCPFGFSSAYKSVYEYNPATDTWKPKSDMPSARFLASATAVDGKIYVFGGVATLTGEGFSEVEVYDPSADTWATKEPMPIPRAAHASSAVNGKIYVLGGGERMGSVYDNVLEYNPTLDTWKTKTPIPTPRVGPAACSVGGKIYVMGGMDEDNTRLTVVEEYDPALDITSVVERNGASPPVGYSLNQNYPNPFNPTTGIGFRVSGVSEVKITVYDVLGRAVAVLVNEEKAPGSYEVKFDGSGVAGGVYLYRLTARQTDGGQAGDASTGSAQRFVETKKMLLLR
jgi:N-acetylneuraminic acid mutarotase